MALTVGATPVKSVYVGSTPVTAVYVGSQKVWPTWATTVQITLGSGWQARDQFRAALTARGLDYTTITEVPFDIELVGTGSTREMFSGCSALTSVPEMDTSQVTNMYGMFEGCSALTSVPGMDTSQVTNMGSMFYRCSSLTSAPAMDTSSVTEMGSMFWVCPALTYVPDMITAQVTDMYGMFYDCAALTDGNVRLIGKHPQVDTTGMIDGSGLTREPWYNADGTPDDGPTIEVHQVSVSGKSGTNTAHPLLTVTVPAGETWAVTIEGTVTRAGSNTDLHPFFRIGATTSDGYAQGAAVNFSGTINATDSTIALVTRSSFSANRASFVGTVTIEK